MLLPHMAEGGLASARHRPFELIASRYEIGSILVTFSDDVVAAAMIDRLVHHAEVLTLTSDSYRTRARRELPAKDRTNS